MSGAKETQPRSTPSEANEQSARHEEAGMTTRRLDQAQAPAPEGPRRLRAADVLGPRGLVQIEHEGEIYTLRLTRNNRLILTK
jgi:hemin uptake protein HemP